ncbi:MAG: DUF4491 family protein [Bacteroidales bacterium]|nr:DUF4491 family protein [Bacteroidales bacterium]
MLNWSDLNVEGFAIGLLAFVIIGVFHPVVIKVEYHFGKKAWPVFLFSGVVLTIVSLFSENTFLSVIFGVTGFALFWSTFELFQQHKRVLKGQAKKNPNRSYD